MPIFLLLDDGERLKERFSVTTLQLVLLEKVVESWLSGYSAKSRRQSVDEKMRK